MAVLRLWGAGHRVLQIDILAAACGIDIEVPPFTVGVTNKTPDYLKLDPEGKVPLLETPEGVLSDVASICRYVAERGKPRPLYPSSSDDDGEAIASEVDYWCEWATELAGIGRRWLTPILGLAPFGREASEAAQGEFEEKLCRVEFSLGEQKAHLVAGRLTMADIIVATELIPFWLMAFDAQRRKQWPRTSQYLERMLAQPFVEQVVGAKLEPPSSCAEYSSGGPPWGSGPHPLMLLGARLVPPWRGERVRACFLEFFQSRGHQLVHSISVVPGDAAMPLFVDDAMQLFIPCLSAAAQDTATLSDSLRKACGVQKCVKAVRNSKAKGRDGRNLAFSEVMAAWLGSRPRRDAMQLAWQLLVTVMQLDPDRLACTYASGGPGAPADDEARQAWLSLQPEAHVLPASPESCTWEMPCAGHQMSGHCARILYDRVNGRDITQLGSAGDPHLVEICRIVFVQSVREADGSLRKLSMERVGLSIGLEHLTSALQGKTSSYAADPFEPLLHLVQGLAGSQALVQQPGPDDTITVHLADHMRAVTVAIADGAVPGTDRRGQALQNLLRRAFWYGRQALGAADGFMCQLAEQVVQQLGRSYPELLQQQERVMEVLRSQEANLSGSHAAGIEHFKEAASKALDGIMPGGDAVELSEAHGIPVSVTRLMSQDLGLELDIPAPEPPLEPEAHGSGSVEPEEEAASASPSAAAAQAPEDDADAEAVAFVVAAVQDSVQAAAAAGLRHAVAQVHGCDVSSVLALAAQEVCAAVPEVALMIFGLDQDNRRAACVAKVPDSLSSQLSAADWVRMALTLIGGKGTGEAGLARGEGALLDKVPAAVEVAVHFADRRLGS